MCIYHVSFRKIHIVTQQLSTHWFPMYVLHRGTPTCVTRTAPERDGMINYTRWDYTIPHTLHLLHHAVQSHIAIRGCTTWRATGTRRAAIFRCIFMRCVARSLNVINCATQCLACAPTSIIRKLVDPVSFEAFAIYLECEFLGWEFSAGRRLWVWV